jgi:hypothetical protein
VITRTMLILLRAVSSRCLMLGVLRSRTTVLHVCAFVNVDFVRDVSGTDLLILGKLQIPSILTLLHKFLDEVTRRRRPHFEILPGGSILLVLPRSFPRTQERSFRGECKLMNIGNSQSLS